MNAWDLIKTERLDEAVALLNGRLVPIAKQLSEASSDWIHNNEELATAAGREALDTIESSRRRILIGNIVALLLTALLGLLTLRRIVRPIQALESSVQAIAAGEYAKEVPGTSAGDEIGGLARSVHVLKQGAAAMDDQRWVKSNASRITASVQGAASLAEFGQRLLCELLPILSGGVAAFYVAEETGERLTRVADYGLEASWVYRSNTEPVLQCSHARFPLLVLTRRQLSSVKALWDECTDDSALIGCSPRRVRVR